jgi:hypothetical protein
MRISRLLLAPPILASGLVLAACPPPGGGGPDDAGPDDAGEQPSDAGPDAGRPDGESLAILDEESDVVELQGPRGDVKYLAQVEGAPVTPPILDACTFQNTSLYSFHLLYLRAQEATADLTLDEYVERVIRRENRVWWGGDVRFLPARQHPLTGEAGVLAFTLYTEDSAGNRLTLDDVRAVFARLGPCTPAFAGKLAFLPSSNEQSQTARNGEGALAADGIGVIFTP